MLKILKNYKNSLLNSSTENNVRISWFWCIHDYIWYNFNWEICYAFLEFVFRIVHNLIIRIIIMIIIHSTFSSKILVAKLFDGYENGRIVLNVLRDLSTYCEWDNRFRESINLITSEIRVVCNRNMTGRLTLLSRSRFERCNTLRRSRTIAWEEGSSHQSSANRGMFNRTVDTSDFVSSGAYAAPWKEKKSGRAQSTRDRWKRKLRPNRAFVARSGRSGDRQLRFAAHVSEIEENRIV